MLIWQKKIWKGAIYQSIKLPFDAEVAEKILNVIYCQNTLDDFFKFVALSEYIDFIQ